MDLASRDLEKGELDRGASQSVDSSPTLSQYHSETSASFASSQEAMEYMSRIQTAVSQRGSILERHPTALSRIATQRSQHNATVGAGLNTHVFHQPLPDFGAGKPYPPPLPEKEEYVVEFAGPEDPLHPQNWPMRRKIAIAVMLAYTTFNATFTSSIYSSAISVISPSFMYLRRLERWFAVATAKDLQTIMICRFFGGFFGACPVAVVAAVFSDMFSNRIRGLAITVFAMTVFTGPLFASTVGGFIVQSSLGWRWTEYLTGIMGASAFVANIFFLHETYPPVVLIQKATELRRRTKNWGIHAKQEEIEVDFRELLSKNFSRPFKILFTEPIVLSLSIYMAFLYGLLYLFLTAYPIVFQKIHGMEKGVSGLPYLGLLDANNGIPIPEWRLPPAIVGSVAFAGGLFWFGWSGFTADIHWIVPTLSGVLIGFGLLCIFMQAFNYIIDSYLLLMAINNVSLSAASALAANSILRSLAGAVFPSFRHLHGVNWASTLLGCVAALLIPLPILFYLYGPKLRVRSNFATDYVMTAQAHTLDEILE
ncbi:uncharacterized protein N7477_008073 [Penicillium maclennaniae]|uniref:uncharacterized protein n=1 Tax=Penicillium maclennaniae TaxID=1343394 RepID=UPI00253FA8A9|nr:uncharacterized protein N7477_008073 [Penicillium maclennaniae]KAJ5665625.1 hypothetical protein N7477_008073 [Penicillium maclennaniae]